MWLGVGGGESGWIEEEWWGQKLWGSDYYYYYYFILLVYYICKISKWTRFNISDLIYDPGRTDQNVLKIFNLLKHAWNGILLHKYQIHS